MDRKALKLDSKSLLNAHFKFFFLLFLPVFILEFVGGYIYAPKEELYDINGEPIWTSAQTFGMILILLGSLVAIGVAFICIDAMRQKLTYDQPLQKSIPSSTTLTISWEPLSFTSLSRF
ncbi:hypothetical protein AB7O20_01070 [Lentilactobacillus buchneri]|nr:hypothetical protein [Lentilactobacillus buchneri]